MNETVANATQTNNELNPLATNPLSEQDATMLESVIFEAMPAKTNAASAAVAKQSEKDATAEHVASSLAAERNATSGPASAHVTYFDCIMGRASVPRENPLKTLFTLLMVGGMVTCMVTFNGVLHSGLSFFASAHWMYPLTFCIAFLVRTYVGNPIVGFLASHLIPANARALGRNISMTLINVAVMASIMCCVSTLLLNGTDNYFATVLSTWPIMVAVAPFVNYFVVSPIVKMLFNNTIQPAYGPRIFQLMHKYAMPWTAILGN